MKKVTKKIASILMAFTLFGTGSVITKNVSSKSYTPLTANAACRSCSNALGYIPFYTHTIKHKDGNVYWCTVHCNSCNRVLYSYWSLY